MIATSTITHFHLFCGIGGGALGFQQATPRIPGKAGRFVCLGGVDVDPAVVRDFSRLVGVQGKCLDLFDEGQYRAWHGTSPPAGWREATPADLRQVAWGRRPDIVFTSPPCKGYSSLLPEKSSKSAKYQALNRLALRGIWLALEAWADNPPAFFILENVPRIASRGRRLLDQIRDLLQAYGYAVAETAHDCGELGGLAQSRKRFLLVARHMDKVPGFLFTPPRLPLRSVGSVLEALPIPLGEPENPMHRVPRLSWRTWLRLSLIPPGGDWRDLRSLRVEDGGLADLALTWRAGCLGVLPLDAPAGCVTGRATPTTGAFAIPDPRPWSGQEERGAYQSGGHYGVVPWAGTSGAITGAACHDNGFFSIADPRAGCTGEYGQYGVIPWEKSLGAVSTQSAPGGGRYSVADPRAGSTPGYPVPAPEEKGVFMIRALRGGAWHRPLTTLELALLQGFDLDGPLDGRADSRWRMAIGNAVPPPAARAVAEVMGRAILLARAGDGFSLSSAPVWVSPLAAAVSLGELTT